MKTGQSHGARKQLFQQGLRRGFLTIQEIEDALPPGTLTAAERWLLYYSLRAAEIEIRDESGHLVTVPALSPEELERLSEERRARAGRAPAAEPQEEVDLEHEQEALSALPDHPPSDAEGPGTGPH
ncbi:MAG: RNA polymerase sigma factor region1.1 domain-containing protein [Deltaproteobacteria bacterium]|nr:RNA polymerase sigma factor region1.1 domain-containing protein [Deltaproteobacteria bacterium]